LKAIWLQRKRSKGKRCIKYTCKMVEDAGFRRNCLKHSYKDKLQMGIGPKGHRVRQV
jgi:hypothetical protein